MSRRAPMLVPVGERFGKLTVLGRAPTRTTDRRQRWECRCDCGNVTDPVADNVRHGRSRSCGCGTREPRRSHRPAEDSIGERFGRLVAQAIVSRGRNGRVDMQTLCDCGTPHVALLSNLRSGASASCGCAKFEATRTHGMTGTLEHHSWAGLIQRCTNPKATNFDRYGGRGITVCERWLASFEAFLADMGPSPSPAHSVDRIDNDGHYEPSNCRWATRREQATNTRRNLWLEIDGVRTLAADVCRAHGITRQTFSARVRSGMDPVLAATKPVDPRLQRGGMRDMSPERRREVARMGHAASRGKPRHSLREHLELHTGAL